MESSYPYSVTLKSLQNFIEKIPQMGIPERLTNQELVARGFKSSNDRSIPPVLKFIGVIDETGKPTELWRELRAPSTRPQSLARMIQNGYSDLYGVYPDAHQRSDSELRDFFATKTKAGDRALQAIVATFKLLVSLSRFGDELANEDAGSAIVSPASIRYDNQKSPKQPMSLTLPHLGVTVNVDEPLNDDDIRRVTEWLKEVVVPWLKYTHPGGHRKALAANASISPGEAGG